MGTPEEVRSPIVGVFDRSVATYDRVNIDFFQPMGRELVQRTEIGPGEHVLDAGCGRGAALFAAAGRVGESGSVIGVDPAPTMVELTGAEIRTRRLVNATVRLDDAERPNFLPSSFDVVIASLVIFFMSDPQAALRHYATLVRPGGRVGFSSFGAEDERFVEALRVIAQHVPDAASRGHRRRHSPLRDESSIRDLLDRAGYHHATMSEAAFSSRFRDPEHWFEWTWSHGGRGLLERVPADRLADATAAAFEVMEQARVPSGGLVLTTGVRFTVAWPDAHRGS
jgi:ubiquinone/menaquinone biosynthesis C-methylase UbiE